MAVRIGAHRGAMCHAPENTLAAFAKAVEFGTYRIELDVRRTRDGVLVLLHDDTLHRTTDGHGPIAALDYADLRAVRAGGEPVPTLAETLEFARDRVRLLVEVKDAAATDDIVTSIRAAGLADRCTISCFDEGVLRRAKELCPAMETAFFHLQPGQINPAELPGRLGVGLLIVWPAAAVPEVVGGAREAGLDVRAGLPDNLSYEQTAAEVERLVALGVNEISCGRPDWIGRALGSRVAG